MTRLPHLLNILLVEDEDIAMLIHGKMLEDMGHKLDRAKNGKQALEMARNRYDIIFMDIGLPDLDGFTVASTIRQMEASRSRAVIVALTAYALDEIQTKCFDVGMDDILAKPATIEDFQAVMKKYLRNNHLSDNNSIEGDIRRAAR